jgi:hypothetical protein
VSIFQIEDSVQVRDLALKKKSVFYMNLANKKFRNNRTGEIVTIIDSFEDIAVLENKQKLSVTELLNPLSYTEEIDPLNFFNNQGSYNILAEKIKNIPTHLIKDDNDNVSVNLNSDNSEFYPNSSESAIIMTTEEDEKAELARKYGASIDNTNTLRKQNDAFAKILGEDAEDELPQIDTFTDNTFVDNTNVQRVEVNRSEVNRPESQPVVQRVEDPIVSMFRNVKRNVEFKMTVDVTNKIPRLDFIEMMEDSYETSIIDFLADEFTNKILQDPSQIRETIKNRIKQLVYGGEVKTPVNTQITDSVTKFNEETGEVKVEKTKTTRKPRAKKESIVK